MAVPWAEFGAIALAHALAVIGPGPDFALVLRQSLREGRRVALWSGIGIGSGILVHAGYTVFGLGLVLKQSPAVFAGLKLAGAAYLGWLGVQSLRGAGQAKPDLSASPCSAPTTPRAFPAWVAGFLTNALNPKAALFFIALFPALVSPSTPRWVQAGYGAWMALATMAWFALVAVLFAREPVRRRYWAFAPWVDRSLGVVFLAFAASVAFMSLG